MTLHKGKLTLDGMEGFENPLDCLPLKRKLNQYSEWRESERTSFRSIWIDRYEMNGNGIVGFESLELKISNRGKCFLDGKELKKSEDVSTIREIFSQIRVE